MSAITARHHPRSQDVGTCSTAWCDRPVEHEGECMRDDGAPAADRCPACGLRPTFVGQRLCENCTRMVEDPGGCEFCGLRHGRRITCSEAQHRIDGPEHAQMWEPTPPRTPVTQPNRSDDEWDWAS